MSLTTAQAQTRLKEFGYNEIIDTSKATPLKILLRQIQNNFVIYMLAAASEISFFVGKPVTAYTILAVIVAVIFVGFIQEYKAEEAVSKLKNMLMVYSVVFRGSKKTEVPSRELVPDDVIVLGNGEKIPADCIIIENHNLKVNEATLTGESKEVTKNTTDQNLIYMGTYIVNGRCLAQVTHTGMNTKFGKIAHLITTAEKQLPLQKKVNDIAKYMVTIALISSVATGLLMLWRTPNVNAQSLTEILILVVALAVSAFPEGFPVVLATTLALGAKRMSQKNAVVSRMSIIETLGEVTIICSDKTGTITKGEMTAKFVYTGQGLYEIEGSGYVAHGKILENGKPINLEHHTDLIKLIYACVYCNDSEIDRTGDDNEYSTKGTPTEAALLIMGAKAGIFKDENTDKRINESPFNSSRKMMSVVYKHAQGQVMYTKGAPEIILGRCVNLASDEEQKILSLQKEMSSNAYRTLAVAYKNINPNQQTHDEKNLTFLGLVAMEDSPREEVRDAIKIAQNAGIRVLMITGDSKETAISIAKQVGLGTQVLDGFQIDQLSDQELSIALNENTIYARVLPEHKIRLVRLLKNLGEIVAMTGDGVNDAPALKEAHVGIAMGKNGTDVSRAAADLVLKDDNFATIVAAVAEGRTVYNNIRKFVTYQLSCSMSEIIILFFGVSLTPVFGWQIPILVSIQILFMNLVTDNMPAITLGANPTSSDIMEEKPQKRENILNKNLLYLLIVTAVLMSSATLVSTFISHNIFGDSLDTSRTTTLLTLILVEIVTAFSFRSFRKTTLNRSLFVNKPLVLASLASLVCTILIIYTPINKVFETTPLDMRDWFVALGCTFVVIVLNDLIKLYNRTYEK